MPSQPPPPIWKTGADALEDDMANRGMLPKFRPATLGVTASVRPLIRPVKAAPAPPVPSPPRRSEAVVESQAAIETERLLADDDHEMPTANGEASTLNRGPVTVPREMVRATPRGGRGNVMQLHFEDETQARTQDAPNRYDAVVTPVHAVKADLGVDYDALPSLEVRAQYESEGEFSQGGPEPITQAAIRESAPVRRVDARDREEVSYRRAPDSYEEPRAYQEADPGHRAPEPSYREPEPSYPLVSEVRQEEEEFWGRREGSGPRSRPVPPDPPRSYAAPVPAYDDDSQSRPWGEPPPLAPVTVGYQHPAAGFSPEPPMEMRGAPAFVMGVQPIRTSTPDAWGTPQAQQGYAQGYAQGYQPQGYLPSPAQAMPAGYGVPANQVHPYVVQARGAQPTQWPPQPQPYYPSQHPSAHPSNHPSGPQAYPQQRGPAPMPSSRPGASVGASVAQPGFAQLASPQSTAAKVGRFAWFVAGAAFGIMFAFFATGFFSSTGSANKGAAPTQAAQAPQAPTQQPQAMPMQQQAPQPFAQPQPQFAPPPFAPPQQPPVFQPQQAQAPPPQLAPPPPVVFAPPPVVGVPQASPSAQQRPQPVAQRPAPPRAQRPAPPVRRPTRASSDDGPAAPAAAPAPAAAGSDLSDLLGAGLKP